MPRGEYLGEFEQMVLLSVARLRDGAYGIAILEEIDARTGAETAVASVYAALDRLQRRGLVTSSVGAPPIAGGGARWARSHPRVPVELESVPQRIKRAAGAS